MSTIRLVSFANPAPAAQQFPVSADDQYPGALWHAFSHPARGALWACTLGGAPIQAEIDAVLVPILDKDAECRKAIDADPAVPPNIDLFKLIRAKAISDLAFRLGVAPGALTGAQLTAERNRIAAIYAAL